MSAFQSSVLGHLAQRFGSSKQTITAYLHKAPRRYKQYTIAKRNDRGVRHIAQPTKALKLMQKVVANEFLQVLPIHDCANAYIKGRSIKSNVRPHLANSYLLKMDFSDFFPSIKPIDLFAHVEKHMGKIDDEEKFVLENLFFFSPYKHASRRLSIGAPSSPFLSNTILFDFDQLLHSYCQESGVIYTRYADDLAFSTSQKNLLYSFPKLISDFCKKIDYPKLRVNDDKTIFSSKAKNRHITGLVITNDDQLSLGRKKKRYIKSLIYQFTCNALTIEQTLFLRGLIAFAQDIEPNFVESLKDKYGEQVIQQILA